MQYFSNPSDSGRVNVADEQYQSPPEALAEWRSHFLESATEPGSSQRAAVSKAYGDILLKGGHFGC